MVSTATRNFHNRLGQNNNVILASAELAAIASKLGQIPKVVEYNKTMGIVNKDGAVIYKTLNFNQIEEFVENAKGVTA
jgi:aconitate hydratase 2/2-methylisocitrate dehydratase